MIKKCISVYVINKFKTKVEINKMMIFLLKLSSFPVPNSIFLESEFLRILLERNHQRLRKGLGTAKVPMRTETLGDFSYSWRV